MKLANSTDWGCVPPLYSTNQDIKYLCGDNQWKSLQHLFSEDGNYTLKMQTDGQIVIWSNGQPVWTNQRLASATNWGAMNSAQFNIVSKTGMASAVNSAAFSKHSSVTSFSSGEAISIRIGGNYGYTAVSLNGFTISQNLPGDTVIFTVTLANGALAFGDHYYILVSSNTSPGLVYIHSNDSYTQFQIKSLGNTVIAGTYRLSAVFPSMFN